LNNPRGLVVSPAGAVYVAEAGTGGPNCQGSGDDAQCFGFTGKITKLRPDGHVATFVDGLISLAGSDGSFAVGVDDVAAKGDLTLDAIATSTNGVSLGSQADAQIGNLLRAKQGQAPQSIGDVDDVEFAANPDGQGVDSDPYGVAEGNGYQVVADAAGNDLLKVQDGKVSVLAVFPNFPFVDQNGDQQATNSVPTRVTRGPDGNFYVGELGGDAAPNGSARIWKVTPQGAMSEYATGFTTITGLDFDSKGNLYVGELLANGFGQLDSGDFAGALIKVAKNGTRTELAKGQLDAIGGVATAPDDSVYVTTNSVFPGGGQLVHVTGH
jgi:hypothetical protein